MRRRHIGVSLPLFLDLTDGTTTVDLVHGADGFFMDDWVSKEAQLKDGGIYRDSPLTDNSSIALANYANVIEEIVVTQSIGNTDAAAAGASKLRRLLRKARDYWNKAGVDSPIYLHWQEREETREQYAIVVNGAIPELRSLLSDVQVARDGISVFIERQHWVESVPNTSTPIPAGTAQLYSDYTPGFGTPLFGNTDYDADADTYIESLNNGRTAFVANHQKVANITDFHLYTAGSGTWSKLGTMVYAPTPSTPFMDTSPANQTNSALYFGIDSSLDNSGPFSSIVFNYTRIEYTGGYSSVWEYYDGATWQTLTVWDNTGASGGTSSWETAAEGRPRSIHWVQPSDWATVNLLALLGGSAPNVTAWWVRCRFSVTGITTAPTTTNEIYTISWASVKVPKSGGASAGDIDPLIRLVVDSVIGSIGSNILAVNKLYVGTRRIDRGGNFVAYLNAADTQNPSGVTFTAGFGSVGSSPSSHTGRRQSWTPGSDSTSYALLSYWTLDSTIAPDYKGRFRMFARVGYGGNYSQGDFKFKGFVSLAAEFVSTAGPVAPDPANATKLYQLIELGDINVPTDVSGIDKIIFWLGIAPVAGSGKTIYIYDIILMPVDEYYGYFQGFYTLNRDPLVTGNPTALDIDPISFPRSGLKAHLVEDVLDTPSFVDGWRRVTSGPPRLQRGQDQRIWFLFDKYDATDTTNPPDSTNAYAEVAALPQVFRLARFLGSRG